MLYKRRIGDHLLDACFVTKWKKTGDILFTVKMSLCISVISLDRASKTAEIAVNLIVGTSS